MYSRTATLKSLDPTDFDRLPNFVHELRTHSMYRPITDDLMASPGFVRKEYIMRDEKEGQTFFSKVIFENKETFDEYMNQEANQSLWIYLELAANQRNISFTVEDSEENI
jgi:hypothetical protein